MKVEEFTFLEFELRMWSLGMLSSDVKKISENSNSTINDDTKTYCNFKRKMRIE